VLLDRAPPREHGGAVNRDDGVFRIQASVPFGVTGIDGTHHLGECGDLPVFHSLLARQDDVVAL
jgi:hypothetical protein